MRPDFAYLMASPPHCFTARTERAESYAWTGLVGMPLITRHLFMFYFFESWKITVGPHPYLLAFLSPLRRKKKGGRRRR